MPGNSVSQIRNSFLGFIRQSLNLVFLFFFKKRGKAKNECLLVKLWSKITGFCDI